MFILSATSIGLALLACLAPVQASPIGGPINGSRATRTVAERPYQSGGLTCYSVCPPSLYGIPVETQYSGGGIGGDGNPYGYCYYSNSVTHYDCYFAADGTLMFPNGASTSGCPAKADEAGCNTKPDKGWRKRAPVKERTPAEELIAGLQYTPKKRGDRISSQRE